MAYSTFIQFNDVDGSSKVDGFEKAIKINSWNFGVHNYAKIENQQVQLDTAHFDEIVIRKLTDLSTPPLMALCAAGKAGKELTAVISVAASGGSAAQAFVTITLKGVRISYVTSGGTVSDLELEDTFGLIFTDAEFKYIDRDAEVGAPGSEPFFGFDLLSLKHRTG